MRFVFALPLNCIAAWEVRAATPFGYSRVVALFRNNIHTCNGALYWYNAALVPSECTTGIMSGAEVGIFRHNLARSDADEAKLRLLHSPEMLEPSSSVYGQFPQRAGIQRIHVMNEMSLLLLDVGFPVTGFPNQTGAGGQLKMVGWGEGEEKELLETISPLTETNQCDKFPTTYNNPWVIMCVQESYSREGVDFKPGTPLFNLTSATQPLVGLLALQELMASGVNVASLIKVGAFEDSIKTTIMFYFKRNELGYEKTFRKGSKQLT